MKQIYQEPVYCLLFFLNFFYYNIKGKTFLEGNEQVTTLNY